MAEVQPAVRMAEREGTAETPRSDVLSMRSAYTMQGSSEERWADITDDLSFEDRLASMGGEGMDKDDAEDDEEADSTRPSADEDEDDEDSGEADARRHGGDVRAEGVVPSVGSGLHHSGRCKPCAFFHTKGCTSGEDCMFCHLCPPMEKKRRKRLRRQLCFHMRSDRKGGAMLRGEFLPKARSNHVRQPSDASTASASTACPTPSAKKPQLRKCGAAQKDFPPDYESAQSPVEVADPFFPPNAETPEAGCRSSQDTHYAPHGLPPTKLATAPGTWPPLNDGLVPPPPPSTPQAMEPAGYITYNGVMYALMPVAQEGQQFQQQGCATPVAPPPTPAASSTAMSPCGQPGQATLADDCSPAPSSPQLPLPVSAEVAQPPVTKTLSASAPEWHPSPTGGFWGSSVQS